MGVGFCSDSCRCGFDCTTYTSNILVRDLLCLLCALYSDQPLSLGQLDVFTIKTTNTPKWQVLMDDFIFTMHIKLNHAYI